MMATGYQATVTSGDNKQISRTSFHPENAQAILQAWIDKQIAFAQARNISITWEITEITGKTITKVGA
jgi:2-hydroxy-3-keto-5-methylthiopentenyl-1-phosphate phosphatase